MSLIGTWMQRTALGWLVLRLTGSELLLGVVAFANQILTFPFSPVAGVLADRHDRRRMLVLTQGMAMVQALLLAALTLANWITVWQIVMLSLLLGMVSAFDIPIRQAFNMEMVESREDLANAVAMNSFMFNGARLMGPLVAGLLIAAVGEGPCFLLNGVSFLGVIASLMAMRIARRPPTPHQAHVLHHLREGARYAFGFAPIREILLLLAVVNLVGIPYSVLMPAFAKKVLLGGPATFGILMAGSGVGAVMGAAYLARRKNILGLARLAAVNISVFGLGLVALSWSRTLWLAVPLAMLVGFCMMVSLASCNTLVQTIVEDDKRGRVMGFYAMSFMGIAPFGALLAGGIADVVVVPWTVTVGGIASVLTGAVFASRLPALRKHVHPIYVKMGIVPADNDAGLTVPPQEFRM